MNKDELKKDCEPFNRRGASYLHAEMKPNRAPELTICGDVLGVLHCLNGFVERISYKTNQTYESTLEAMVEIRTHGFKQIEELLKNEEPKAIEGSDWQEEWKEAKTKEIQKKANEDNLTLALEVKRLTKLNASLNNQIVDMKKLHESQIKARDKRIKDITKECQAYERRMKEMERMRTGSKEERSW